MKTVKTINATQKYKLKNIYIYMYIEAIRKWYQSMVTASVMW